MQLAKQPLFERAAVELLLPEVVLCSDFWLRLWLRVLQAVKC